MVCVADPVVVVDAAVLDRAAVADAERTDVEGADVAQADAARTDAGAAESGVLEDAQRADVPVVEAALVDHVTQDGDTADGATARECLTTSLNLHNIFGDGSDIALYRFDRTLMTLEQAADDYGIHDGHATGAIFFVPGIHNGALSLPSTSAVTVDALPLPTGGDPRTVSVWVKFAVLDGSDPVLTYGGSTGGTGTGALYSITAGAAGEIVLDTRDLVYHTGFIARVDTWHHIVVTNDGTWLEIYIDGLVRYAGGVTLMTAPSDQYGKVIGGLAADLEFSGQIDQLRFLDRRVSAAEAGELFKECAFDDVVVASGQLAYEETFGADLSSWSLWGSPLPVIIPDVAAENGFAFDTNGDANYHSGIDSDFSFAFDQPFAVEFRAKQPQDASTSNHWLYFQMGLTHTLSSGNGTGPVAYISISGITTTNAWEYFNPYGLQFRLPGNVRIYLDDWNDWGYHIYRLEHTRHDGLTYFNFLVDGVMYEQMRFEDTVTDPWHITIQGRSYGSVNNYVDWVKAYTPGSD